MNVVWFFDFVNNNLQFQFLKIFKIKEFWFWFFDNFQNHSLQF
jgi:hypothetical protein